MKENNLNFKTQIKGIWKNLSVKRKKQIFLLTILMVLSALSEVLSLASILPFLAVITNPELIKTFGLLNYIFEKLAITSTSDLRLIITTFFGIAILFAAFIRLLNLRLNSRIAALIISEFSCKIYKNILMKPYYRHLETNSAARLVMNTGTNGHLSGVVDTDDNTYASTSDGGLGVILPPESVGTTADMTTAAISYVTKDYNTGYMFGDIRGALLSDTNDTDLTGQ